MSHEHDFDEPMQTIPGRLTGSSSPKTTLVGVAVNLAVALAKAPGNGMRDKARSLDDLITLLPDENPQAIQDAVFDLQSLGLVEIIRTIGKHWWLHLTQMFYEQVDHQVMGWNTHDDARTLAKLLREDEARAATSKLHEISGWDKRRFNPAFRALLNHIPDERVSKEIQPNYPSAYLLLLPEDRARLRRFISPLL
jgi:hypothetical protein